VRKLVISSLLGASALVAAIVMLTTGVAPRLSGAADHLDAPFVKTDGRIDINDVYAFQSPSNPANTVLIMTTNPVAGVLSPTSYRPGADYRFNIDRDGDARPDISYRLSFEGSGPAQDVQLRCVPAAACGNKGAVLARGQTGATISVKGGGSLRAGLFDDPFFFDLLAFRNGLAFCPGGAGTNFFAGFNVMSIVLEVPSSQLGPNNIGVWATTSIDDKPADRMGRPAINTVFNHTDADKNAFNFGKPINDQRDFRKNIVDTLLSLGDTQAYANAIADVLLPDILTVDTSNAGGFLNGRRLQDDVIDTELSVISNGAITTDCVANDSVFSSTFPYLAPPN